MQKLILFIVALISANFIQAQISPVARNPKCSPEVNVFIAQQHLLKAPAATKSLAETSAASSNTAVLITTNDMEQAIKDLRNIGGETHILSKSLLYANVPSESLEEIAGLASVQHVGGLTQFYLSLDKARAATKADVVQAGTGLDTPFTGKGVTIGIVDTGIDFSHPAFRLTKDSLRIKRAIVIKDNTPTVYNTSAAILAKREDYIVASHGTHVAGIAAGGTTCGNATYCGMAPEANLVLVAEDVFSSSNLALGAKYIKDAAKEYGTPYIINMSLGSDMCSHDGYSEMSRCIDSIIDNTGILVAAAGNSGELKIHAQHTFTSDTDEALYLVQDTVYTGFKFFCTNSDASNLSFNIYTFDESTGKCVAISTKDWERSKSSMSSENNPVTKIQETYGIISLSGLNIQNNYIVIGVKGKSGNTMHMWLSSSYEAEFATSAKNTKFIAGDYTTAVCDPAEGKHAIAVGNYITKTQWYNADSKVFHLNDENSVGELARSSAKGPSLNLALQKPEVVAPGTVIASAIKNNNTYPWKSSMVVNKFDFYGTTYSYGLMNGTSMASPATTGIIALWLQANPSLTYDDVVSIIKQTSLNSSGQLKNGWDNAWGFGIINAYDGLKLALQSRPDAINTVKNTATPLTFQTGSSEWKLLFNNAESYASISLYTLDGRQIKNIKLQNISCGQEEIIPLEGLSHGVYLLRATTRNASLSRKVMVE